MRGKAARVSLPGFLAPVLLTKSSVWQVYLAVVITYAVGGQTVGQRVDHNKQYFLLHASKRLLSSSYILRNFLGCNLLSSLQL
jgi:hypothetical protein